MAVYERGIDVSRYQGLVNWPAVAGAGIQFAMVRIGSSNGGAAYVDPYFQRNVQGAHDAGMKVGAYYFTYAKTREQVNTELETFLPALTGLRLEYPVFVDVESHQLTGLGRQPLTELVRYAMDILDQSGWLPGYYTYTAFAQQYLDTQALAAYPLWIADYRGYVGYSGSYDLWQYSLAGQVAGIEGNVDLDYSYKNFLPLLQEAGLNGYGTSRPAMQALSGKALQVTSARCEYFYSPNVDDVAGYLPLGTYPALELSEGTWHGYVWVTFRYEEQTFWAVLLEDRDRLIDAPAAADCTECEEALEQLRRRVENALALMEQALDALEEA